VPSFLGQKQITMLNWERYSEQQACRRVRTFVVEKYCKFRWLVTTSIGGASSFEVVLPTFEGIVDGREFFVVNVVVGFGVFKHPGVERNRVVVAVWGSDGQYCG